MNLTTPFFICSAEPGALLAELLDYADASLVEGRQDGIVEQSVLVPLWQTNDNAEPEFVALFVGRLSDQESVLLVNSDRSAALLYCNDGRLQPIGRWREVRLKPTGDYTEIDGRYFQAGV